MKFSEVFPVIALIAGWLLNELSRYLGLRRGQKGAIAQALAELLEIRHQMVSIRLTVRLLHEQFGMPPEAAPDLSKLLRKAYPVPAELHKRYDDAVTLIASSDPVLAFELRSKNLVGEFVAKLSALADSVGEGNLDVHWYFSRLEDLALPEVDRSMKELARRHGLFTYFRVKRLLNRKPQVPTEVEKLIREMKQRLGIPDQPHTRRVSAD